MAAASAHRGGGGLSLCLTSVGVVKTLSIAAFTLVWTHSMPARAPMPELVLANSGAAGEWRLCSGGNCRTLSEIFGHPIGANTTTMRACDP